MTKSLIELWRQLSRVKPWVAVALALGLALAGYYAVVGVRYVTTSSEVASLKTELAQLSRRPVPKAPPRDKLEVTLASQKQRLEQLDKSFDYPRTDDLVAILSATAEEADVVLASVAVADRRLEKGSAVQYWTQPMALIVQGETANISAFLSALQEKVPVARVASVSLSGLEAAPSAQVQLLFYLSPEAVQAK